MYRATFFDPHFLPEGVMESFPKNLHYAAGEQVIGAENYVDGAAPNLRYPHLFWHAKMLNIAPNAEFLDKIRDTKYTVIVGPSGSGRNTLIEYLLATYPATYAKSLSVTTRGLRYYKAKKCTDAENVSDDEQIILPEHDGQNYFHRAQEEVLGDILDGKFLEWEIIHNQQVSGLHFDSFASIPEGLHGINDTELEGARKLHELDERPAVFVIPLVLKTWLAKRIEGCGEQEKQSRLESSLKEFECALKSDYFAYFIHDMSTEDPGTKECDESIRINAEKLHNVLQTLETHGLDYYNEKNVASIAEAKSLLTLHIAYLKHLLGHQAV